MININVITKFSKKDVLRTLCLMFATAHGMTKVEVIPWK